MCENRQYVYVMTVHRVNESDRSSFVGSSVSQSNRGIGDTNFDLIRVIGALLHNGLTLDKGRKHVHHIPQETKLLCLCDFQPNKVANVLPDSRMTAQALKKGAALVLIGSGRQRTEEEHLQRGMRFRYLFSPPDKSFV